jgi:hypothetical protein
MIFFKSNPNISKKEFRQICAGLKRKGFNRRKIKEIEQTFLGDLNEKGLQEGIDKKELEERISWMRKNARFLRIPKEEIDILEKELKENL